MCGTTTGVHSPSSPASVNAGCSALFGHTFMHSPQRMQRCRKSLSRNAPGGRISRSSVRRKAGGAAQQRNRCDSRRNPGESFAPLQVRRLDRLRACGKNLNSRLWSGHASTQFRHMTHSALRHGTVPIGSSPPWQRIRQRLQSSQVLRVLLQNRAPTSARRCPAALPADRWRGTRTASREN